MGGAGPEFAPYPHVLPLVISVAEIPLGQLSGLMVVAAFRGAGFLISTGDCVGVVVNLPCLLLALKVGWGARLWLG